MADQARNPQDQANLNRLESTLGGLQAELERIRVEAAQVAAETQRARAAAAEETRLRQGRVGQGGEPTLAPEQVEASTVATDKLAAAERRAAAAAEAEAEGERQLAAALRDRAAATDAAIAANERLLLGPGRGPFTAPARAIASAPTTRTWAVGAGELPAMTWGAGNVDAARAYAQAREEYAQRMSGQLGAGPRLLNPYSSGGLPEPFYGGVPAVIEGQVAYERTMAATQPWNPNYTRNVAGDPFFAGGGGAGGGRPPTAGGAFFGDGESEQSRANRARAAAEDAAATNEARRAYAGMDSELASSISMYGQSSDALRRHGALTTEFFDALRRGEVTLSEVQYQLGATVMKFAGWTAAAAAVFGVIDAIKQLVDGAKEAQSAVQNLTRFIPNLNRQQASQGIIDISSQVNVPIADVGNASMQFARVTGNLPDTLAATRTAMIATKLDSLSTADSVRYFTSIMQELGLRGRDLPAVFDQISNAQRRLGARTQELLPALAKSMGAVHQTGGDFSQLIGLEAAAQTLTGQTGSTIGTAFARGAANFYRAPKAAAAERKLGLDPTEGFTQFLIDAIERAKTLRPEQIIGLSHDVFGPLRGGLLASIFTHPDQVQRALQQTTPQASRGSTADELGKALGGVGEQVKHIGITFQDIGAELAQGGVFQGVGLLLHGVNDALGVARDLLQVFNGLPAPVRDAVTYLGEGYVLLSLMRRLGVGGAIGGLLPGGPERVASRQEAQAQVGFYEEQQRAAARRLAQANDELAFERQSETATEDSVKLSQERVAEANARYVYATDRLTAAQATQADLNSALRRGVPIADARAAAGFSAADAGAAAGTRSRGGVILPAGVAEDAAAGEAATLGFFGRTGQGAGWAADRAKTAVGNIAEAGGRAASKLKQLATMDVFAFLGPFDLAIAALIGLPLAINALKDQSNKQITQTEQVSLPPSGQAQLQQRLARAREMMLHPQWQTGEVGTDIHDSQQYITGAGTYGALQSVLAAQRRGLERYLADIDHSATTYDRHQGNAPDRVRVTTDGLGLPTVTNVGRTSTETYRQRINRLIYEAQHSYEAVHGGQAGQVAALAEVERLKQLLAQSGAPGGLYGYYQSMPEAQLLKAAKSDATRVADYASTIGQGAVGTASLQNLQSQYHVALDRAKANPTSGNLHTLAEIESDINTAIIQPVTQGLSDALALTSNPQARAAAYQNALNQLRNAPGRAGQVARQGVRTQQFQESLQNTQADQSVALSTITDPVQLAEAQQQDDANNLATIRAAYSKGLASYKEVRDAVATFNKDVIATAKAIHDEHQAQIQANQAYTTAGIDPADTVAIDRANIDAARRQLALDRGTPGTSRSTLTQDAANVRGAIAGKQRDIAQNRYDDIQFYASIGQISAQTEIDQLEQLDSTIKNNKALKRQIEQQLYSLKQGANASSTSGIDMNIGNIKLPTVYEIRRAIAARGYGNAQGVNVSNTNHITMQVTTGADVHDVFSTVDRIAGSSLMAQARSAGIA